MCMSSCWWYCAGLWKVFAYIKQTNEQIGQKKQEAKRKTIQKRRFQTVFAEQFYWTALISREKSPKKLFCDLLSSPKWWTTQLWLEIHHVWSCEGINVNEKKGHQKLKKKLRTNEHVNRTDFISRRFYYSRATVITIIINIVIMWADVKKNQQQPQPIAHHSCANRHYCYFIA